MYKLLLFSSLFLLAACDGAPSTEKDSVATQQTTSSAAALADEFSFYTTSPIAGSQALLAKHIDLDGNLLSMGLIENGKRQGGWVYYASGGFSPVKVEHYLDGQLHGAYLEIDQVGRVLKAAYYVQGKLEGNYGEFRASHPQLTATYKDGQLDGLLRSHILQNGKVQQSVAYKNGVQEGPMRWYNEQGEIIQERMYKQGELVD